MKKGIYSLFLLLAVGCSSSYEVDTINSSPQSVTAHFEEASSRLYIDQNKLYWNNSDEISLFPSRAANTKYRYNGETGSRKAEFDLVSGSGSGSALSCNYAVYPYSDSNAISADGVIEYTFPKEQEYVENSFGRKANVMVAATNDASDTSLQFKNAVGYLKLSLYGNNVTVKSIKITGNKSEKLAGNATIKALYGQDPVVTMSSSASSEITLNCGDNGVKLGSTASTATTFWLTLPPTTFTKGITLTVTDVNGNTFEQKTTAKLEIARNTIQPMDPLEITHQAAVNNVLPAWSEGYLDIHFINSGRGECCFYILPDGTTLLVDAGEIKKSYDASSTSEDAAVAQRPNTSTRPYMVYAKYIKHFAPYGAYIDWCAPSHFHIDHIGSADMATASASAANGGYKKAGLTALYDEIDYRNILDRAYPDYPTEDGDILAIDDFGEEWAKFVRWGVNNSKFTAARFAVGEEQITLKYNKSKYSNFRIFNICANGRVWQKKNDGSSYVRKLTLEAKNGNNPSSCGFHLSYGQFDYIACGDLTSAPQNCIAYYVRDFIGDGHFDAFKCHHHFSSNAWGSQMDAVDNFFEPRVITNNSLFVKHNDPTELGSVMNSSWDKDFFATNLHPKYISANSTLVNKISGYNGHIVIRVKPGGGEYNVYMLDDTNFEYRIKSIHGPYTSK